MPRSRRASRKSWVAPAESARASIGGSFSAPRRELLERGVEDPDVIAGMVGAGIAGT